MKRIDNRLSTEDAAATAVMVSAMHTTFGLRTASVTKCRNGSVRMVIDRVPGELLCGVMYRIQPFYYEPKLIRCYAMTPDKRVVGTSRGLFVGFGKKEFRMLDTLYYVVAVFTPVNVERRLSLRPFLFFRK